MASSYNDLFVLTTAQQDQVTALEAAIDAALSAQADPGETAFVYLSGNGLGAADALVRSAVKALYTPPSKGWSTVEWQSVNNQWVLILAH